MAECQIVVAGHICLDLTPRFFETGAKSLSDILRPGALAVVGGCVVSTGGPVANTGLALVKLGVKCRLMGKVGEDAFGRMIIEKLGESGCAEGIIQVPGEDTSYTIAIAPPGIDRVFVHNPGANDSFCADDIDYGAVAEAHIFHLGYPPLMRRLYEDGGDQLATIFRRARECGATTSLDMALPDPESPAGRADWAGILAKVLPDVDLFQPSAEEVLYFLDRDRFLELRAQAAEHGMGLLDLLAAEDYGRLAGGLLRRGAGVVVLKCGHHGLYARTNVRANLSERRGVDRLDLDDWSDRELWQPPYRVEHVVSATGAGDCAVAGFLAAFLRGDTIERAMKYAAAVGAQNVTAHDAISGVKSYAETTETLDVLAEGEFTPVGDGWRYDEARRVWRGPADSGPPG